MEADHHCPLATRAAVAPGTAPRSRPPPAPTHGTAPPAAAATARTREPRAPFDDPPAHAEAQGGAGAVGGGDGDVRGGDGRVSDRAGARRRPSRQPAGALTRSRLACERGT